MYTLSLCEFSSVELTITESTNEFIKVVEDSPGAFELLAGQRIRGFNSGNVATINTISENTGQFEISYSLRQDQGWKDDIGKLNQDYQLLPDNDYYQNLSYTVKSSILYEDLINPVNRLLHTSGLKNFADVGITSSTSAGVTTSTFLDTLALDFVDQKRVDTINNFDFALDIDTVNNKSKFLKLQNTKLSPYIECRTNRVLEIDDISGLFSNTSTSLNQFLDLSINAEYVRFLVQIRNPNNKNTQLSDIVLFKDANDVFTAEQAKIHNTPSELGELKAEINSAKELTQNEINKITEELSSNFKSKIKLNYNHEPSLIGGLVVQVGSTMIDTSIKKKLQQIETKMIEA